MLPGVLCPTMRSFIYIYKIAASFLLIGFSIEGQVILTKSRPINHSLREHNSFIALIWPRVIKSKPGTIISVERDEEKSDLNI